MGCAQSRVDNEESVTRCKERKTLMKEAVIARNAFAAAHSGYAVALKSTGAALSDYGHGETDQSLDRDQHQHQPMDPTPQPPPPPPMDNLPPPPPLPNFSPSPIKRAHSMPTMAFKGKTKPRRVDSIAIEEGEEEEVGEEEEAEEGPRADARRQEELATPARLPENTAELGKKAPETTPPPPMPEAKPLAWDYFFMVDDINGPRPDEREDDGQSMDEGMAHFESNADNAAVEVEPVTPEKVVAEKDEEEEEETLVRRKGKTTIEHYKTAPPEFRRVMGQAEVPTVSLMNILQQIDDRFLKASESAQEVSKMLEATRLHYHSNFADNRGYVDHSARVMRVITWNKSFRGITNGEGGKEDLDSEEHETHATVLDKLLAWEKKLYEEVKQGELMKIEYQRKVYLLNKQKKRGASSETLEKTKAAVSHLHTRYIVDMQSMDSTVSEVNRLRDEQLYPKLVALVNGTAKMWSNMCTHHDTQLKIVEELKALEGAQIHQETTKEHYERTRQLCTVVDEWQSQFEKLIKHQKQYIQALNSWLKLNLIPIESSLKEKVSSPPRPQRPPIQALLQSWHDYLEKLPDELAKSAISSFGAVFKTILLHQEEEMKLKEKCDETRREFLRKNQAFEEWYQKYAQKHTPDEGEAEKGEETNPRDPITERRFAVDSLKKRLEEEMEAHQRLCVQVKEKSLNSLKIRLPEVFRAMSDYAHACADAYEKLRTIIHSRKPNADGPPRQL